MVVTALLACWATSAMAHPHVFVEQRITLLFGAAGLDALRVEWTFDELYSASLIADFLANKKRPPSADQVKAIEREAFANAAQVDYFVVLKLDDKPAHVGKHRDFTVELDGPKLRYRFVVPVAAAGSNRLVVNALDDEWFIDFFLAKTDPIRFEAGAGLSVDCGLRSEPQKTVLGMVDTQVAACEWRAKP